MKILSLVLISGAVIGIGLVLFFSTRQPTIKAEIRDMGKDIQRGARDAYHNTKDAAEDAKDKAKDVVR